MHKIGLLGAAALCSITAAVALPREDKKVKVPTEVMCAVQSTKKVTVADATEKKMFADYKGYRYYFCCGGCPAAFKKDPAKFASNDKIRVALAPTPATVACAVQTGKVVNVKEAVAKKQFIDVDGKRYVFCCGGCPAAFKSDPEKFVKNESVALAEASIPKEMQCAVMPDHKVNVKEATGKGLFADSNGKRFYFCCEGCPPAFKKDPAKFAASDHVGSPVVPPAEEPEK